MESLRVAYQTKRTEVIENLKLQYPGRAQYIDTVPFEKVQDYLKEHSGSKFVKELLFELDEEYKAEYEKTAKLRAEDNEKVDNAVAQLSAIHNLAQDRIKLSEGIDQLAKLDEGLASIQNFIPITD